MSKKLFVKIPQKFVDQLRQRVDSSMTDKEAEEYFVSLMLNLKGVYEENKHRYFWGEEERQATYMLLATKHLTTTQEELVIQDMKRADEFFKKFKVYDLMDSFADFLSEILDCTKRDEFKSICDSFSQAHEKQQDWIRCLLYAARLSGDERKKPEPSLFEEMVQDILDDTCADCERPHLLSPRLEMLWKQLQGEKYQEVAEKLFAEATAKKEEA